MVSRCREWAKNLGRAGKSAKSLPDNVQLFTGGVGQRKSETASTEHARV
jgi:hypothetical protein